MGLTFQLNFVFMKNVHNVNKNKWSFDKSEESGAC